MRARDPGDRGVHQSLRPLRLVTPAVAALLWVLVWLNATADVPGGQSRTDGLAVLSLTVPIGVVATTLAVYVWAWSLRWTGLRAPSVRGWAARTPAHWLVTVVRDVRARRRGPAAGPRAATEGRAPTRRGAARTPPVEGHKRAGLLAVPTRDGEQLRFEPLVSPTTYGVEAVAVCGGWCLAGHPSVDETHPCGLYAMTGTPRTGPQFAVSWLSPERVAVDRAADPPNTAEYRLDVVMSGRVVVHEHGVRAGRQSVVAVWSSPMCTGCLGLADRLWSDTTAVDDFSSPLASHPKVGHLTPICQGCAGKLPDRERVCTFDEASDALGVAVRRDPGLERVVLDAHDVLASDPTKPLPPRGPRHQGAGGVDGPIDGVGDLVDALGPRTPRERAELLARRTDDVARVMPGPVESELIVRVYGTGAVERGRATTVAGLLTPRGWPRGGYLVS